jgi:formylglycine-generating enzyme required for sulfatase activity
MKNNNEFIRFEGGRFKLGETKEPVTVEPFGMSAYLVTNHEYEEFDSKHQRNKYSDQDDQPVVNVSWQDAVDYCRWLSKKTDNVYHLPTEAEWEFAASGGGQREYPWGNEQPTPERANYANNLGKTSPVGSYPDGATPEGLYDMAGNVWEWCADWYDTHKYSRVIRGGAFVNHPDLLCCAIRLRNLPHNRDVIVGFRVVCGL